jgi:ComF family protein
MSLASDILTKLRWFGAGAIDLLLPGVCMACGREDISDGGLCQSCNVKLLSLVAAPYCRRCGAGLPAGQEPFENCLSCPPTLPRFESVIRLGSYAEPLRSVVRGMKYHRQEALRRRLGTLLAAAVRARATQISPGGAGGFNEADSKPLDLVLSIPMHWRRRLARGYDHARILAATLARELDLPLGHELIRIRHTPPQAHLSKTRRLENVRGAFDASGKTTLAGSHVLLVDDVTTTGATADEATRALLKAGVSSVTLAVIAKSEPPRAYAEQTVNP